MSLFVEKKLLTVEECDVLFNHITELEPSTIIRNSEVVNSNHRTSFQSIIKTTDDIKKILLDKLKPFNIINLPPESIILRYEVEQEFKWHRDRWDDNFPERFKTLVIQLSDNYEYEGGNLIVNVSEDYDNRVTVNVDKGNCVLFRSDLLHCCTKVLSGTRYSFVSWLRNEDFNL